MKRKIQIIGTYNLDNKTDSFTGTVTFDERENSIYYSWKLFDKDGKSIGAKSLNVTFQPIPAGLEIPRKVTTSFRDKVTSES